MKQIYMCEKCGTQYEEYDDAYKCEESHVALDLGGSEFALECWETAKYSLGHAIPDEIVLPSQQKSVWNEDAQKWEPVYTFGVYKLVKTLSDKDVAKIIDAKNKREEQSRREWEEYMERRGAEKKAKKAESEMEYL